MPWAHDVWARCCFATRKKSIPRHGLLHKLFGRWLAKAWFTSRLQLARELMLMLPHLLTDENRWQASQGKHWQYMTSAPFVNCTNHFHHLIPQANSFKINAGHLSTPSIIKTFFPQFWATHPCAFVCADARGRPCAPRKIFFSFFSFRMTSWWSHFVCQQDHFRKLHLKFEISWFREFCFRFVFLPTLWTL